MVQGGDGCLSEALDRERQVSRRLQTILDTLPNGVNLCSLDGRIIETNPSLLQIMEADHAKQVVGHQLKEFLIEPYHDQYDLCLAKALGGEPKVFHLQAISFKGRHLWLESHLLPMRDADNEVTHFLSIIYDRTQDRRAEEAAWQRQAKLAHVSRLSLMGEMASGLAHEINQPLTAIINYVKGCERRLRKQDCSPEEMIRAMERVYQQAQRAGEIVKQVRRFVKQGYDIQRQALDLNQLVEEAITLLEVDRAMQRVRIELQLSTSLPLVEGDTVQIEQVLINLLRNGIEAVSAQGSGMLTVSTLQQGQKVLVSVRDNGSGLSQESEEKLFEPFFTTKSDGMGMGLSVSLGIIELHGGRLWAENHSEGGAVFHFVLPVLPDI